MGGPAAFAHAAREPLHAAALRSCFMVFVELLVLLQEPADVLDRQARARRDPPLARAVDEVRMAPLRAASSSR